MLFHRYSKLKKISAFGRSHVVLVIIQNCICAFSTFSFIITISLTNGLLIHKLQMNELHSSLFTLGILAGAISILSILDSGLFSTGIEAVFSHWISEQFAIINP